MFMELRRSRLRSALITGVLMLPTVWVCAVIVEGIMQMSCDNSYGDSYDYCLNSNSLEVYWVIAAYLLIWFSFYAWVRIKVREEAEYNRNWAREQKKLAKIKSSMTPAEWANYEIQMEIKHKLDNLPRNNSSSTRYGMFTDFGD
jgi:hypothetical protein